MIKIHEKASRGSTRSGWLTSDHTFSFGGFNDPTRMGFGNIRVINEDRVIPNAGFSSHEHSDMDILTLVLDGRLRHEDDAGNIAEIGAGEIQHMAAGRGVNHSEWNASDAQTAHFLQIWLLPDATGGTPRYDQAVIPTTGDSVLAGPEGSGALMTLGSPTLMHLKRFAEGDNLSLDARSDRLRYVHLLDGLAFAETERVSAGDGMQIPAGLGTSLSWVTDGAALVFDMPRALPNRLH